MGEGGSEVEVRQEPNASAVALLENNPEYRRLAALYNECAKLARSKFIPEAYKDDVDTTFALARYGEQYGLSPIHSVARLYVINGKIEPSADVLAALVIDGGHELRYDETSSTRCTVSIRRAGTDYWQSLTWTIDDARRAGLLDLWVEEWKSTQGGKRYAETFVVGHVDTGVNEELIADAPDWVKSNIRAGKLKAKENWQKYPDDMLAAKAIRRAVKRFCPDVLLNLALADQAEGMPLERLADPTNTDPAVETDEGPAASVAEPAPADDDIEDAVLVDPEVEEQDDQEDATHEGGGDDDADVEALPADQPGGSTPREGGDAASEPPPASGGGPADEVAEPVAGSGPAPTSPPPAAVVEQPLAGATFTRSFAIHVREADMGGRAPLDDEARHAIVAKVTGGRTRSVKEVWASEVSDCWVVLKGIEKGQLELVDVDGVRTVREAGAGGE
ncbi:MAG: hypothetical protein JWN67_5065 [Actinomycetia bacterium]|nr:hypothetical protein [Actinomycetes bacterium]